MSKQAHSITLLGVLAAVQKMGTNLAYDANPQSWRHEERDRAEYYKPQLEAARVCYANIRRLGLQHADAELSVLCKVIVTGQARNSITLIQRALRGQCGDYGWTVNSKGFLEFMETPVQVRITAPKPGKRYSMPGFRSNQSYST